MTCDGRHLRANAAGRAGCSALAAALLAASLFAAAPAAQAGIVFTPHLAEYAHLPRGAYADHTLVWTRIDETYDAEGNEVPVGFPNIAPGDSIEALSLLFRYLWVGNLFENTQVPWLNRHDQIFRVIANLGWQRGTGEVDDLSRTFGQRASASGLGDLYLLAGIYNDRLRLGPLQMDSMFAVTTKLPVGDYDRRSLLNIGTNYWTHIPQVAVHQEWFGRLLIDATFAYQINGDNDEPAYGGLTPTHPADVRNLEINAAWKFSEHWYADVGWSHRETVGPNRFDQVTLAPADQPIPPQQLCDMLNIGDPVCDSLDFFHLAPVPGSRQDRGVEGTLVTAGLYYVYRSSAVLNFRAAVPVDGRGSQFPMEYDIYLGAPDSGLPPISRSNATLSGVQEAASVSASPFFELRFVYLFWAP